MSDRPTRRWPLGVHLRKYAPFYVFGLIALIVVAVAPTVKVDPSRSSGVRATGAGGGQTGGGTSAQDIASGGAGPVGGGGGAEGGVGGVTGESAGVQLGTGTTRGGFPCSPGVRQLPWSAYAAPCVAQYTGDNGGATWNGVTGDKITVVIRGYASDSNGSALDVVLAQAGVDRQENRRRQLQFIEYFSQVFELYGRTVEVVPFTSSANPFDEANGKGREQACADATRIHDEMHAFAVLPADLQFGPFTECAAQRGLVVPIGAYGFPQSFYDELHPYAWGVQMSCTRIASLYVDYVVTRLAGQNAIHAKDPIYQNAPRRFGLIEPDIPYYFPCEEQTKEGLARAGVEIVSTFAYTLDPSTLPAQMTRAAVQFKFDGVSSLLMAVDFLSMINLSQAAKSQGWGPEWIMQGSGLADAYSFARLYDQDEVDKHMFGMSQVPDEGALFAPDSELVRSYMEATGETIAPPEPGNYFAILHMFNQLQSAGPYLTPDAIGAGTLALPPSDPSGVAGIWNFNVLGNGQPGVEHTSSTDAREVYWDRSAPGPDGAPGNFVSALPGRYSVGQWPQGAPTFAH